MQTKFKIFVILILIIGMFSCIDDHVDIYELDETIYVRHKNADMPAYIHGNASEKVFLILLHGGPGGNGVEYRLNSIRTEIEKNNAVVYFDQRGSGNSQGNYAQEDVSLDLMAEDILALAKVIRAKYGNDSKLFLMGHSWGGTLGSAALLKDQSDFLGWINVDGEHNPKGAYDLYKVAFKEMAEEQMALGNSVDYWQSVLDLVRNVGPNFSLEDYYYLNATAFVGEAILTEDNIINYARADYGDDVHSNNSITFQWNKIGIAEILDEKRGLWENVSFTDRLHEITIPSLVLWGKYDLVVPKANAKEAFDNLGSDDKELFIFEKSGHSPIATEPDLFGEKVIDFINKYK